MRSAHARCRALWVVALAAIGLIVTTGIAQQGTNDRWIGTWGTALVARPAQMPRPATTPASQGQAPAARPGQTAANFSNQTLRQIVRISIGSSRARVVLSNTFGTAPLVVGAAYIGLREKDATIVAASGRALTFGGRPDIAIPAGALIFSDPVNLTLPPASDVAVDFYFPGDTNTPSPLAFHSTALQTSYVSEIGNHAGKTALPVAATIQNWFVLSRVEVTASPARGVVVTLGASLTDGARSTPDTNNRWPNHLARRLLAEAAPLAVLDEGISGNRLVGDGAFQSGLSALARFDRDVLDQTGVTHVIVADMALNDIGNARENPIPTADDLIAGMKQLIERAHARGVSIYGATLTPFEGAAYFTQIGEAKRQVVNQWIRTSKAYDAVIDFDSATRDPDHPLRFLPQYDSGDHLHPNDTGYRVMAESIDLTLFKAAPSATRTSNR